jgi:hypothetical protein
VGGHCELLAAGTSEAYQAHIIKRGFRMRIRRDVVFVSSLLLTFGLLSLVPMSSRLALSGRRIEELEACYQSQLYAWGQVGKASMALIGIGLVVTWTGYIRAVRSAWFVMFIIVWVWAFPLFFQGFVSEFVWTPLRKLLSEALEGPGSARGSLYAVSHFAPMVIALILPIKPFFFRGKTARDSAGPTSGTTIK